MSDELNDDLREAALLEPMPRGPGRPAGAKNKSTSRTETRKRVALHRQRKREKLEAQAEAAEEARVSQEKLFRDMRADCILFFGETAPLVNCTNIAEEVEMARIWARLLNVRDIKPSENQKAYILEVMKAWCAADCPLLHLESKSLSKRKVDVPDVEQYVWPDGSDAPFKPNEYTVAGEPSQENRETN
jgi:hypothetical protein